MRFSEKYGFRKVREVVQKDGMDDDLRNRLWDLVDLFFCSKLSEAGNFVSSLRAPHSSVVFSLWHDFYKEPWDTVRNQRTSQAIAVIRKWFFECDWYEVYDFLQFLAGRLPAGRNEFAASCNKVLEEEKSAYRFVGTEIVPITSEEEMQAIEAALKSTDQLSGVNTHLQRALELFGDRSEPDYRNSVKESISAVESLARLISGQPKAALGEALKAIDKQASVSAHAALTAAFRRLYGYTSDEDGIRHAMQDEGNVGPAEAQYMLVACSAFVSYLVAKAGEAGITLAS